ncbi:hypothetical protein HOU08_gp267 [Dickeya phage vB_DsoM_JA29]|uniref:Uncharacterized protein n=1 Tax=Dickeya phage vB_DsoM_JA29 TaxID=2283031 RepID=A0A384ZXJ5_9CAUD|nr:hypothetical protein HOU08_gp267 [Dickeya phage vB_DsoM_JA29]AXG66993.1 hypothetical protein JA29_267 [Dickeya phage vB_DsoM_JA29]
MYHRVIEQPEPVSPKQFQDLKTEQKKEQETFIRRAIKRANTCLLEIAGGETPSPYYGRDKNYPKEMAEYAEWLESDYAQKEFDLVPGLIHLELCHLDCIDPPKVYAELRQRFIDAGWGESTRVHKRAGPENMVWVSLDEI